MASAYPIWLPGLRESVTIDTSLIAGFGVTEVTIATSLFVGTSTGVPTAADFLVDFTSYDTWQGFNFGFSDAGNPDNPAYLDMTISASGAVTRGNIVSARSDTRSVIAGSEGELMFFFEREAIVLYSGRPGAWTLAEIDGVSVAPVPLPATLPLGLATLGGLAWIGRNRAIYRKRRDAIPLSTL